jgi:hypothetical protein
MWNEELYVDQGKNHEEDQQTENGPKWTPPIPFNLTSGKNAALPFPSKSNSNQKKGFFHRSRLCMNYSLHGVYRSPSVSYQLLTLFVKLGPLSAYGIVWMGGRPPNLYVEIKMGNSTAQSTRTIERKKAPSWN